MPSKPAPALHLKEACLIAAREVIAEHGVEGLSMRDVARKLGVSHQAPYRHFESRDHLLAEVIRRCFVEFAEHLDRGQPAQDCEDGMSSMGSNYMHYAEQKPLEYRLMFGTPWPEPAQHPDLVRYAAHAFNLLRNSLRHKHGGGASARKTADLDALFIWASLHGLASIKQANVMAHLDLSPKVIASAQSHMMRKISIAMNNDSET